MSLPLLRCFAYGVMVMVLACVCTRADEPTTNQSPSTQNAMLALTMEIRSVRLGPENIRCEVLLTNNTDKPIRIGQWLVTLALGDLELRDASGQLWHVKPFTGMGGGTFSFERILPPHVPQSLAVSTLPGQVLEMDSGQNSRRSTTSPTPNGTCHYRLASTVRVCDVYTQDMEQSSKIPIKIEGDTLVAPRVEKK